MTPEQRARLEEYAHDEPHGTAAAALAHIDALEARVLPVIAPDADDTMGQTIPITESRLFDLVRYMRYELSNAGLITMGEWTWLTTGATPAVPGGGSPARNRLERYDEMAKRIAALTAERDALASKVAFWEAEHAHDEDAIAAAPGEGVTR